MKALPINAEIQESTQTIYAVCGRKYLSLWQACYRLAKHQLVDEYFKKDENGEWKVNSRGQLIGPYSLYCRGSAYGDSIPITEEELDESLDGLTFRSEAWCELKRLRARQLLNEFKAKKKEQRP